MVFSDVDMQDAGAHSILFSQRTNDTLASVLTRIGPGRMSLEQCQNFISGLESMDSTGLRDSLIDASKQWRNILSNVIVLKAEQVERFAEILCHLPDWDVQMKFWQVCRLACMLAMFCCVRSLCLETCTIGYYLLLPLLLS